MKTIARLVITYFTATPVLRIFSALGLLVCVVFGYLLTQDSQSGWFAMALSGVAAWYVGSSLMPLIFGRIARGHLIRVLPFGRLKLLLSAVITVALVSAPLPLLTACVLPVFSSDVPLSAALQAQAHSEFLIICTGSFLLTSWLFLALWFMTSTRTSGGFVKAMIVISIAAYAPTREILTLEGSLQWNLVQIAATFVLFGGIFLIWPRLRVRAAGIAPRFITRRLPGTIRSTAGREVDLMLGTANPWLLAALMLLPIALASRMQAYSAEVWLYFLTIFSTVAAAIAGQAAGRSRTLWLRGAWSRAELFAQVERSFWRYNGFLLATMLVLMLAIGVYGDLPRSLLAAGFPLLILGTALSTYLGLMVTRSLGWLEAVLGVSVMLTLMALAVLAAQPVISLGAILAIELLLAGAAVALRSFARARWAKIDWAMCRPERIPASRSA